MKDKDNFSRGVAVALKTRRKKLEITLASASRNLRIKQATLSALERGDYGKLPHNIYTREFVRRYANYLGLSGEIAVQKYLYERGPIPEPNSRLYKIKTPKEIVTTKLIIGAILGLIALLSAGYLVWQLQFLTSSPQLEVYTPKDNQVVREEQVTIRGKTSPGSEIYINSVPIFSNDDGSFEKTLHLNEGINSISIESQNSAGKSSVVKRTVIVELDKG